MEITAAAKPEALTHDRLKAMRDEDVQHWKGAHDRHDKFVPMSYAVEGTQWDPSILELRGEKMPCYQFGFIDGMVAHVVNPVREEPPSGVVKPVGTEKKSKDIAAALTGVLRADDSRSGARDIYLNAYETQVRGGLGAWRYLIEECDGKQIIRIESIDPTDTYPDRAARRQDLSDARRWFHRVLLTDYEYADKYPNGTAQATDGAVEVWEAWIKEKIEEPGTPEIDPETLAITIPTVKRERVRFVVFDDLQILEDDTGYLGKEIPFVLETAPMAKDKTGAAVYISLTHKVEPAQKDYNFWRSDAIAEQASRPRAKWVGDEDAMVNPEQWTNSPVDPVTMLLKKKGSTIDEITHVDAPSGHLAMAQASLLDARTTTGIYPDPSLQGKMDAPSGKAIRQQRAGSGVANYQHLGRHLSALKRGTRIHIDLVAAYYTDDQIRESIGVTGEVMGVSIGPNQVEGAFNIDMDQIEYLVDVDSGASYATQSEQDTEQLLDLAQKVPSAGPIIGYHIIKASSLKGSDEIADAYLATLPPEMQKALNQTNSGDQSSPEEQLRRAEMEKQQLLQALEQALAHIEEMSGELAKIRDQKAVESQIAADKNATTLEQTQMNSDAAERLALIKGEIDQTIASMRMEHEARMKALDIATSEVKEHGARMAQHEDRELEQERGEPTE